MNLKAPALDVAAVLGEVGLPAPIDELAARRWDAIVVGAGHNGLTAAAYLARAGRSVLVLERSERIGGACTLERPFDDAPGYVISPCAYVVGLLDGVVIRELELERHGYRVTPADPNSWSPLPDGTSMAGFLDHSATVEHMRSQGFSERDIRGVEAYDDAFQRLRDALRRGPEGDTWQRPSPSRAGIERILGGDAELTSMLFSDSIGDVLDRYIDDERIKQALFGQGVIGTFAGPRDAGTASIHLMHSQGDLQGRGSVWGYVEGGMGRISFAIAEAAIEAGAVIAAGVEVAGIDPGEGVTLASGESVGARVVVANADPKRTLAMLDGAEVPAPYRERLEGWRVASPVVKLNAALSRPPAFTAAANGDVDPLRAMVSISPSLDEAQAAVEAARRGEPRFGFCELYFQTAYDPSVAPEGKHVMSVFAQYAPYELAEGDWEGRRGEVADLVLDAIAERAPDVRDCIEHLQVLGPPDIEERIGLSGGHIFQGEALPDQMWDRRLTWRTPVQGLYLCGAATHPGGSVIALNGRGAARAVLGDTDGL
ncbi:MAG: phytoene desaturase family protein [Solirubrobacterales bacterium]